MSQKKIIIAPLNWGLGHATRCIPIIKAMISFGFTPIIASDGLALQLLQKEFPEVEVLKLPSYNIFYGKNIRLSLALQTFKIQKAVRLEQKLIKKFVEKNKDIIGIISDGRFGVRSKKVKSVYITHQLNVLSGKTTFFTTKIHQRIIKKFDECWVPDFVGSEFSGKLSKTSKINVKFLGMLSRFEKKALPKNIDILAIVSGVEPNRTLFENKLKQELTKVSGNVVLICGKVQKTQSISTESNLTIYNFVLSNELENLLNSAKIVVCRSGYSSVMDLATLHKRVIFVPTKGQTEQEYLASYLSEKKGIIVADEENFSVFDLKQNMLKITSIKTAFPTELFGLFERK